MTLLYARRKLLFKFLLKFLAKILSYIGSFIIYLVKGPRADFETT